MSCQLHRSGRGDLARLRLWPRRSSWPTAFAMRRSTSLAPTGTISFVMDCDTTGIEPDYALVKHKNLAGGGHMKIVNQSIEPAFEMLGYDLEACGMILMQLEDGVALGKTSMAKADHAVFACVDQLYPMPHVKMVAAV